MGQSTYALDHFDHERTRLGIGCGLESIGNTRFGTIYWSAESVLRGIDALVNIVRNTALKFDNEVSLTDNVTVFKQY